MSDHQYTIEQQVNCGNCICPPPVSCLTSNNVYVMKDKSGNEQAKISENSSFLCRCICMPCVRTSYGQIQVGGKTYHADKGFRCGYLFAWMCCHRPEVIVKNSSGGIVGRVELPCYPQYVCKIQVDCYKGEGTSEQDKLWTIKKCACNCHSLFGKMCGCCGPAKTLDFEVSGGAAANSKVGRLQKEHFSCVNECFTMADKYNVDIDQLDDDSKAVFLAAVQFIDMLFFESNYMGGGSI